MRVDGDRIGALEVRHAVAVALRQPGAAAVGRVDVEPQVLGAGDVGELADRVDRSRVGRARDGGDRERRQAGRAVPGDGRGDRRAAQVEVVVGGQDDQRVRREPELVERPRDREVGLVARVDPGVLEVPAARRAGQSRGACRDAGRGPASCP